MIVNIAPLHGKPLILRRIGEDDYSVRVADLSVGRIMLKPVSGGSAVWLWSITGPYMPPQLQPSSGDAGSLDDAKTMIKSKWLSWMFYAASRGGEAEWHVGSG